jgi:hypothetical protein
MDIVAHDIVDIIVVTLVVVEKVQVPAVDAVLDMVCLVAILIQAGRKTT